MDNKLSEDLALSALKNLIEGATTVEEIEEYIIDDNKRLTLKGTKKVIKKLPPDLSAIKTVLSMDGVEDLNTLSDEELEKEKQKLLKQLLSEQKEDKDIKKQSDFSKVKKEKK